MFAVIRRWADRIKDSAWPLIEALSGAEDPRGDDLRRLDDRVRRLEAELAALRPPPGQSPTAANGST